LDASKDVSQYNASLQILISFQDASKNDLGLFFQSLPECINVQPEGRAKAAEGGPEAS